MDFYSGKMPIACAGDFPLLRINRYMKIGIDSFGCDHARSGLGTYLLSFIANYQKEEDITVELFGSPIDKFTYTSGKDIKFVPVNVADSLSAERRWHVFSSQKFVKKQGYDAVLYPAPERVIPISFKTRSVVVVNSVLDTKVDDDFVHFKRKTIKKSLDAADKIIAASQFIADDLVLHGIDKNKIEVIYNGIDHKLFYPPIDTSDDFADIKPFAIRKPYFTYGSKLSGPEKKHIELIKAFSLFKERTGLPHRLVIAGSDGKYSDAVHKAAFESPYAAEIFLTGFFPHESFAKLYSDSAGCIFPSTVEGVGLPILEAMATGVPVACSSACALPEIAGNSAIFFDSDNIEEIATSMEKIVVDDELKNKLIANGLERAQSFNWENTARKTIEVVKG